MTDTIFAEATARGRAGVAVIRISGPRAIWAAEQLAGALGADRAAVVRALRDEAGEVIDTALVIGFAAPRSFTGEDVVEMQCHGSLAVMSAVLGRLQRLPGLRLADPGEFTRRALQNGRLSLSQVEGLSDLLAAETEMQRRLAQRVASGAIGALAQGWRGQLVRALALMTAAIDFSDEDLPEALLEQSAETLRDVRGALERECAGVAVAERIRDGFVVAILGRPNVGKSTLLNVLAGREAAITSSVAGTTRDVIEVRLDLGGLPVTLLDTAGLRESDDAVEALGMERARARADSADLRIILVDEQGAPEGIEVRADDIVVRGKADLGGDGWLSGTTGQGVDRLVELVRARLAGRAAGAETATRARHRVAMERAAQALGRALDLLNTESAYQELVAEEVQAALRALDSLVGRVDVEDVLDDIFTQFCLGK